MYALTEIKGVGRRYSNIVCKKADVDLQKRYVLTKVLRREGEYNGFALRPFVIFFTRRFPSKVWPVRLGTTMKPSWFWCKRSRYRCA